MNYLRKSTWRKTLSLGLASIAVISFSMSGCKKANPLGLGGCDDVVKLAESYGKAWKEFSEDPSVANCEKWKKILQDYYNAAKKCTLYPNYLDDVEDIQKELGDIDCSEYANNGN